MYFLGYVELFHPKIHGFTKDSDENIQNNYMTIFTLKNPAKYLFLISKVSEMDFYSYYNFICENFSREINCHKNILFYINQIKKKICFISEHPTIRNYLKIQDSLYEPSSLHIFEKIILETGESICILKTFWIKCIQRKWKKICNYNKKILKDLTVVENLKKREIINIHSRFYGLRGMWYKSIPSFLRT
jgi:hypothetical protein